MVRQLNVGLVGLGFIGRVHVNAYHAIPLCFPNTPITARMSALLRSQPAADVFQETAGFSLVTHGLEEFFSAPLDLVDLCTPNRLHMEHALAAMERGLPVYCEKPLARTLDEAVLMQEAATNMVF